MSLDELVRINVNPLSRAGRKTCVSLDSVLFAGLVRHHGSREAAVEWVRRTADRVDQDDEHPRMGLSRKIHRQAYCELLGLKSHNI